MDNDAMIIDVKEDGFRLRDYLEEKHGFSSKLLIKLEANGKIFLNGKVVKIKKRVFREDEIAVEFLDESDEYEKVNLPIDIIYEDDDFLVLNKKPFRVVHPTKRHQDDTTANAVSFYFDKNDIKRKVRFVNRLDMNTSGVLVIAKNPYVHNMISQDMRNDKVDKHYKAIVDGILEEKNGKIIEKIARIDDNIRRVVHESGKDCTTVYSVIEEENGMSLIDIRLETGRTHQIRVHFEHLGAPVLGDELYGTRSELISRQALHCSRMVFKHPRTGKVLEMVAELPEDMKRIFNSNCEN
ncbi:23S rRNA pseudouridine1911/1915/1917 synthase [Dethiosulfatibacter aminovorans DSM 17477]|uniref:Pseudouridine synthase n=1 Tax=Dethiosulfatibacter aminovorans DSM 17477 TaxID=1121476 RepID=A0A1M6G136_9FIRM|nr:RluA family pseudouridine synthase [Dethiosulfatibacter aminovorans]SHJ03681.1 23S rRNA pseudouridine1911/1915/1917 synthase [Dethiosulfatibacter aminovorans DSM 17477]